MTHSSEILHLMHMHSCSKVTQAKCIFTRRSTQSNTTAYTSHKKTHAYTLARKAKKKNKWEKSHQFLCKIAHLLLFHRCFPFISEGQTVTPATSGTSLHTEEHCCNFPTAYCERGRSLSLISEWGGKQMQFFFFSKKSCSLTMKSKQRTLT